MEVLINHFIVKGLQDKDLSDFLKPIDLDDIFKGDHTEEELNWARNILNANPNAFERIVGKRGIYEHLRLRNFPYKDYRCWIDEENCNVTVPIYTLDGRWVGIQEFRPKEEQRYITVTSEQGLWGLETVPEDHDGIVYIVEGIFRATALHGIGRCAVALLGSSISKDFQRKLINNKYKFVWIGDPTGKIDKGRRRLFGTNSPEDLDEMSRTNLEDYMNNVDSLVSVNQIKGLY